MTNAQNRKRWAVDQRKKARAAFASTLETWDTVQIEGLRRMYFNIQLNALMRGLPVAPNPMVPLQLLRVPAGLGR